ncbi:MAG TPA: TIR domain-containing protein [Aggregatilineaceae bacterium]|nr:TIR domain-containing protein [Aggregatilineaceae bacterium]
MAHVFISYSKRDRTYARQLADKLREEGFNVWIDDRLDYGEEWWSVIVQAIQDCTAFIVIMSNESKISKWVKRELGVADHQNKPMFPLLLEGENWDLFVWTQYLDVRGGQLPPADFFDALDNVLPRQAEPGIDVTQSMPALSYPPREIDDDLGELELPQELPAVPQQSAMSAPAGTGAPVRAHAPTPANIPPPAFALGQGGGGAVWTQQATTPRPFPLSLTLLRRIVGGIVLLTAILMFFGFFSASWMNAEEDVDDLTAWDIWKGKSNGEAFTLDLSDENASGGFGDVRGMDRLLLLIPLGAVVLGVLAIQYTFGRVPLLEKLSRRNTAIILTAVALLLFLYPSLWESSSSSNWRDTWSTYSDADYADYYLSVLEDSYSTGQQAAYGLIALLAGIAAVALETPQIRARLGLHK